MTSDKHGLLPVSRIIEGALRESGVGERLAGRAPLLQWREIAGPEIAAHVRAVDLADGVLVLEADHGAWRQEVTMLAPELLAKFNARFGAGTVNRLQWRQGARPLGPPRGRRGATGQ